VHCYVINFYKYPHGQTIPTFSSDWALSIFPVQPSAVFLD
jgi:hypothetical protein